MKVEENIPLASLTTFKIGGPAKYFTRVGGGKDLAEAAEWAKERDIPIFILGGGSNLLVSDNGYDGLLARVEIRSDGEWVGAGEELDEVVKRTVESGLWGIENLSFIPGTIGGAVYMNAGAYGQEIGDVVESVEIFDLQKREMRKMDKKQCQFGYRSSIFMSHRNMIILRVLLALSETPMPVLTYPDIDKRFADRTPSQREIREAVTEIRKEKGQDWRELPSAGSFFKNIVIEDERGEPRKISAGFLLDKSLGLKGLSHGGATLSHKQVINMVNMGSATARDCMELFKKTRRITYEKSGLVLEPEPEFVGFTPSELEYYFEL